MMIEDDKTSPGNSFYNSKGSSKPFKYQSRTGSTGSDNHSFVFGTNKTKPRKWRGSFTKPPDDFNRLPSWSSEKRL